MLWHEKTWQEIDALDRDLPVIIPLGALEQHGPHLPLFVDSIQIEAIAQRAEKALDRSAIFLPTLWVGCSHHHMEFPGTVSLLPSLYAQVIKSMVQCVLNAKFRRIFLLNGHGGNETPMSLAMTELIAEQPAADNAILCAASWWQVGKSAMEAAKGYMQTPFISHACEYETSLMLAIRSDLVHADRAVTHPPTVDNGWWHSELGGRVWVYKKFYRVAAEGSMGQPTAASAEKGEKLLASVTDQVVQFVRDFATWDQTPPIGPKRA